MIAACQVVIDEQTPLAQVSVAEALVVVVVEPPPLEPQPAARNTNAAPTAIEVLRANGFHRCALSRREKGPARSPAPVSR